MPKKASMGRQNKKIIKIKVMNHLQVTLSKCHAGIFRKASELCKLCGVEIAIIVFFPGRKAYFISHTNAESTLNIPILIVSSTLKSLKLMMNLKLKRKRVNHLIK